MTGECGACGEVHDLQQTPRYGYGTGAMLCGACYHLNITLGEGPERWGRLPELEQVRII